MTRKPREFGHRNTPDPYADYDESYDEIYGPRDSTKVKKCGRKSIKDLKENLDRYAELRETFD